MDMNVIKLAGHVENVGYFKRITLNATGRTCRVSRARLTFNVNTSTGIRSIVVWDKLAESLGKWLTVGQYVVINGVVDALRKQIIADTVAFKAVDHA